MAKEKKAKVELTLEELQAKKAKTQRGWVRFCAILLAVLLTVGIYGVASQGDPNVVNLNPNVVRVNTQTVSKGDTTTPPATTPSDDNTATPAPTPSTEEGGGILDTIMGLLGGLDFSKIAGMLDINGLGIKISNGIDKAKDSLLTLVDKIEGSITKKPVITHEAVEEDFAEGVNVGDAAVREAVVEVLNNATAKAAKIGSYTVERKSSYVKNGEYGVSVGAPTETINTVLSSIPASVINKELGIVAPKDEAGNEIPVAMSLDTLVGEFNGAGVVNAGVSNGKVNSVKMTIENGAIKKQPELNENYFLMATQLTADDIAVKVANEETGEYEFVLKNVAHPNRKADCGLTRFTNDYLVQNELAPLVAGLATTNNEAFSMVKLSDLEMNYSNICVKFQVNPLTGNLVSLEYKYESYGKFTVRTNTLQVVGAATTTTTMAYGNFAD